MKNPTKICVYCKHWIKYSDNGYAVRRCFYTWDIKIWRDSCEKFERKE